MTVSFEQAKETFTQRDSFAGVLGSYLDDEEASVDSEILKRTRRTTMIISIPATKSLTAYHSTHATLGKGYQVSTGNESLFITEHDADELARYFLFKPEVTE
jgi:hypothetical protein